MASARRTPNNPTVRTYGGGTRQFTSLSTWEALTDNDLVTAQAGEILDCYADAASFDDRGALNGSTSDSTYYRLIRAAAGNGHNGTAGTGVTFNSTNGGASIIGLAESYAAAEDLVLTLTINSGGDLFCLSMATTGTNQRAVGCLAVNSTNSGAGTPSGFNLGRADTVAALCLARNNAGNGFAFAPGAGNSVTCYNCTAYKNTLVGFTITNGTITLRNCLAATNTGGDFAGSAGGSSTNNLATDTTAPGTRSVQSGVPAFVSAADNDVRLSTADVAAQNLGVALTADATFAFTDSIADGIMGGGAPGKPFGTWDIGFHEPAPTYPVGRIPLGASQSKTAIAAWSAQSNALVCAGETLLVGIAFDNATITSVSFGTQTLTSAREASNTAGAVVALWQLISATSDTTSINITWTGTVTAKAMFATVLRGVTSLGTARNTTSGGVATISTGSTTATTVAAGFIQALVAEEGANSANAVSWLQDITNSGQVQATSGGGAAGNMTIHEGWAYQTAKATRSAKLSSFTTADAAAVLAIYYASGAATVRPAPTSAAWTVPAPVMTLHAGIRRIPLGVSHNKTATSLWSALNNVRVCAGQMLLVGVTYDQSGGQYLSGVSFGSYALANALGFAGGDGVQADLWYLSETTISATSGVAINFSEDVTAAAMVGVAVPGIAPPTLTTGVAGAAATVLVAEIGAATSAPAFLWALAGTEAEGSAVAGVWSDTVSLPGLIDGTSGGAGDTNITLHEGYAVLRADHPSATAQFGQFSAADAVLVFAYFPQAGGAQTASPTAVSGLWATGTPAVSRGTVTMRPPAGSALWAPGTPIVRTQVAVTPAAGSALWAAGTPVVSRGTLQLAPAAGSALWALGTPAVTNVQAGATQVSAVAVSARWSVQTPQVRAINTLAPAAGSALWAAGAPAVRTGTRTLATTAQSALWTAGAPLVRGQNTLQPAAGSALWALDTPVVRRGAVTATPGAGSALWQAGTPRVQAFYQAAPGATSALWATGTPTVRRGALTVTPTAVSALWQAGSPLVQRGGVQAALPQAVSALLQPGTPTVQRGALTVRPAAVSALWAPGTPRARAIYVAAPIAGSALWTAGTPSVSRGAVPVTPAAVSALWAVGMPQILGRYQTAPAAVSALWTVGTPTVRRGTVTAHPAAVSALWTAGAPLVLQGGVQVVFPTAASALWQAGTPSIQQGTRTITPAAVSALWATGTPHVNTVRVVLPTAGSALWAAGTPTVARGAVQLTPAAVSALWTAGAPQVQRGAVTRTPAATSALWTAGTPQTRAIRTVQPAAVSALWAAGTPVVRITGTQRVTPTAGSALWQAGTPEIRTGATQIRPTALSALWAVSAGAVQARLTVLPPAGSALWATGTPQVQRGTVRLTPAAVGATWSAAAPTVARGRTSLTPGAVLATWTTPATVIALGGVVVQPAATSALWQPGTPFTRNTRTVILPDVLAGTWDAGSPLLSTFFRFADLERASLIVTLRVSGSLSGLLLLTSGAGDVALRTAASTTATLTTYGEARDVGLRTSATLAVTR